MIWIWQIGKHVHTEACFWQMHTGGNFNAGYESDALVFRGDCRLGPTVRGVVIGECEHINTGELGLCENSGYWFLAIAAGAVCVQVDLHSTSLTSQ